MSVRVVETPFIAEVLIYRENSNEVLFTKKFHTMEEAQEFTLNKFGLTHYENQPIGRMEVTNK